MAQDGGGSSSSGNAFEIQALVVGERGKVRVALPQGAGSSVEQLKAAIAAVRPECPASSQLLVCAGKRLEDGKALADYSITSGTTIYVGKRSDAAGGASPAASAGATASSKPAGASGGPASATAPAATAAAGSAGSDSATQSDGERTREQITEALLSALNTIKENTNHEGFVTAMSTLTSIIGNLVDYPDEPKYKRLRLTNATLKSRLFSHAGGVAAVKAIGFRDSAEEDEVLYIKKISPHLGHVRQLLQAALEQHARSSGIPISAPSAAARMPGMQAGGGSGAPSGGFPGGFPPFGGMGMGSGNPADAMRMMSDPNVQAMLNDPEFMQSMTPLMESMMSNPEMMQAMMQGMQSGDMMSAMMSNPQYMQQMSQFAEQMQRNPRLMQQMMSLASRQGGGFPGLGGMGGFGGGFGGFGSSQAGSTSGGAPPSTSSGSGSSSTAPGFAPFLGGMPGFAAMTDEQEEAMLQEAIRRSMEGQSGGAQSGSGSGDGDQKDKQNDSNKQPPPSGGQ